MDASFPFGLTPHLTPGSLIRQSGEIWRLEILQGPAGKYRLSQLDNYHGKNRELFPYHPPLEISLDLRASAENLPGTWGFGVWNDPFSMALGFGGGERYLPSLPNSAWFFYGSEHNYLSFRSKLPAQGKLASTFRGAHLPVPLLMLGAPFALMLILPQFAKIVRPILQFLIQEDAVQVEAKATQWHNYKIHWSQNSVEFFFDEAVVLETKTSPKAPLGFVLWIDNQFAALSPQGGLAYGTLASPIPAWIEVKRLKILS